MKKFLTLIGALSAVAFAIAPQVTSLNSRVGAIISIVGIALAAFGPGLAGPRGFKRRTSTAHPTRHYRHIALLGVSLICLSILAGCGAARAIYGASIGLSEAITIKRDIAQQGQFSAIGERLITQSMLDANSTLMQVSDSASCFTEYTTDVKANVLRGLDDAITSLDNLNRQGALHIRSGAALRRFQTKIFYASLITRSARTTLALIPAKEPSSESQPILSKEQQRQLEEMRALCRKASAQLKENESRLLEDLARLQPPQ